MVKRPWYVIGERTSDPDRGWIHPSERLVAPIGEVWIDGRVSKPETAVRYVNREADLLLPAGWRARKAQAQPYQTKLKGVA